MVLAHDSYNSCCDLSELFGRMFLDSDVAKVFTLGKTKCRYTMYLIAPGFKQNLIFAINYSPFYSVTFDESMNSELQICQMDGGIRFWNNDRGLVETRYYDSQFIRRPNAESLLSSLIDSINHLDSDKLLQLAMDGPNVNWLVVL